MTDSEEQLLKALGETIEVLQKIKFICERAKKFNIEEEDIDDILELLKGTV